jgi:hypothetical protein
VSIPDRGSRLHPLAILDDFLFAKTNCWDYLKGRELFTPSPMGGWIQNIPPKKAQICQNQVKYLRFYISQG